MGADARDDVGEPGLGLKAVEPGGSHERVEGGCALASCVRAEEQPIFPAQSCWPDLVLSRIVADLEPAVVEV